MFFQRYPQDSQFGTERRPGDAQDFARLNLISVDVTQDRLEQNAVRGTDDLPVNAGLAGVKQARDERFDFKRVFAHLFGPEPL